ncbi:TIGR04104 family putative zinc finger protein [Paenisporosarcina macmurdoensis]|uniref:TIGR04104 family putative zinc finger protein n=1 Tax=Paenisporosarcina macmurdoensis TaxID=212659 RepID=A0ABW1LCF4_9BACL
MGLQTCDTCGNQFNWSTIYKSLLIAYRPIKCSECNTEHRIMFSSRIIASLLIVLPMYIFVLFISPPLDLAIPSTLIIGILFAIIFSLVTPYLIKYRVG